MALTFWQYLTGGPKSKSGRLGRELTKSERTRAERMRKEYEASQRKPQAAVRVKSHTREGAKVKAYVRTRPRSERGQMLGELIGVGFTPFAARKAVRGGAHIKRNPKRAKR